MHPMYQALTSKGARSRVVGERRQAFLAAVRNAPTAVKALPSLRGGLRPANPAALLADAAYLAGGETGWRWFYTTSSGLVSVRFFWEQDALGQLVVRPSEVDLATLARQAGWPFNPTVGRTSASPNPKWYGSDSTPRWLVPTRLASMSGRGATETYWTGVQRMWRRGSGIAVRAAAAAAGASMSWGPCCLTLLLERFGCRFKGDKNSGRRGLGPAGLWAASNLSRITDDDSWLRALYRPIRHLNVGQLSPLCATQTGRERLILIQTGSEKHVSDYKTAHAQVLSLHDDYVAAYLAASKG